MRQFQEQLNTSKKDGQVNKVSYLRLAVLGLVAILTVSLLF